MKYFFTYKTTNKVNGKYYLGVHSTDNLDDGYLGSGTVFTEALHKYGKENFIREVLGFYPSQDEAYKAEAKLITREVLQDTNCYNIALGGRGGSCESVHFYVPDGRKYLIQPEAIPKFIEKHPDAIQGISEDIKEASRVRNLGKKLVSKGTEAKLVSVADINSYLEEGWVLGASEGSIQRNSRSKLGIKIMHKGNITRHVRYRDIEAFIQDGYEYGPAKWINKLQGEKHKGYIRISKGAEERMIPKETLALWENQGYVKGTSKFRKKLDTRGTIAVNNGEVTKVIKPEQLDYYLKEGWVKGRSKKIQNVLAETNKTNSEVRKLRSREEAASRRLIYQNSVQFKDWWLQNSVKYNNRPQYGVSHFLHEIHMDKADFLELMRVKGEIL